MSGVYEVTSEIKCAKSGHGANYYRCDKHRSESEKVNYHISDMAEIVQTQTESEYSSSSPVQPGKPGRKSKFTASQDLIIAQEVAAAEAHVAPHGETLSRFEKASKMANENPNFGHKVTGKNIQDRFKKPLDDYSRRNGRDRNMSGTGRELGELDQLLEDLLEAKRDREAKNDVDAKEKADQDNKKLEAGQELVLQILKGKGRRGKESSSDDERPEKKRRVDLADGMQELGVALKESERVRCEFEKEKLDREVEDKREDRA